MNERLENIEARLSRIRKIALLLRGLLALAIFGSGLLAVLALLAFSSRLGHGSAALGVFFWIFASAGVAGVIYLLSKNWLDLEKTALLCESKFPELGDGLISLVQLGKMVEQGNPDFSLALFEKHLDQVEGKLGSIKLEDAAEPGRLKIPFAVFFSLVLIMLALLRFSPGYSTTVSQALLLKGFAKARPSPTAKVSNPLELYDFVLEYQYPAYTAMEPKKVEGGDGSISAIKGSIVKLSAKMPARMEKAWMQLAPSGKLEVSLKGNEISVRMVVVDSGQYRIEALDKSGKLWTEPLFHQIIALSDNVPELSLNEPDKDLVVSLDQKLKLKFHGRDDFGLDSFALVFSSRGDEKRTPVKEFRPSELEADGEYEWDMSVQNFYPGQKIGYYIEAKDNNNATGPGVGKSQVRYIEVFSPLKRHEQIIAKEQELFEALISFLGKSLDAKVAKESPPKYWGTEDSLIKNFEGLKTLVDALKPELAKDDFSPALVKDAVNQASERYGKMIADRKNIFKARNREATEIEREKAVPALEQDILFWDSQLKKQRMDYLLALGERMRDMEKELRKLIEEYKRTNDPELLKDIEARLDELKNMYSEFTNRMGDLSQAQLDEFVNMDALQKQAANDVMQKLEKFRSSVHDRDTGNALKDADDFLSGLDQMLSQLQKGSESMGSEISSEMMAQMESGLDEIRRLREAEEKLISGTEPIYQSQMQSQDQAESRIDREIENMQNELDRLSRDNEEQMNQFNKMKPDQAGTPGKASEFYQQRNLLNNFQWQLRQELQNASKDLDRKDLEAAAARMENIARQMEGMKKAGDKFCRGSSGGNSSADAFGKKTSQGIAGAKSMGQKLGALSKLKNGPLSAKDAATLKRMGEEQAGLYGRLAKLQNQMNDLFSRMPAAPEKLAGQLNSAGQKMKEAQSALDQARTEPGLAAQKEARYWLEQAEKSLEQFKKKVQENSKGGGGSGGGSGGMPISKGAGSNQDGEGNTGIMSKDFEIPGPDKNKDPVELRKQILKAMREGSPKDYEELNRDYYKRLVQ